ncbi:hypothetical protein [Paractinoplanes globisporus]|uniref:Uncharacterized protein n=1 Tax=Paractinoplanes globisporus TaxID=113565 RepID=A0ABW6WBP8_9ACTN|nr:hypothetical protein [Actinoplanes globisporus]
MSFVLHELRETVAVRWRVELAGREPAVRAYRSAKDREPAGREPAVHTHWSTKVSYYRAIEELLAGGADPEELGWTDIVAAVRPRGSRSTFFAVAGPHAKKPLVGAYRLGPGPVREIAGLLSRSAAPEMLVDETKVWSYWPHRDGWMDELFRGDGVAAAECLIRVLLDWAVREPALAAALDHAPPACAIEDLVVIRAGRTPAAEAARLLREAIRLRLAGGCSTDGVVHLLCREFSPAPSQASGNRPLARAIDQLTRNSRTPSDQRRQAIAMMRDAIAVLESEPE